MKELVKPKRGLGQAATRKRRQAQEDIQQRIKNRHDANKEAARLEIERMKKRVKQETAIDPSAWGKALLRTVVANQAGLLRAWGYLQSTSFAVDDSAVQVNAWTDFEQIRVEWPLAEVPNRLDRTATLTTVVEMKGFMQHEMGHIRLTTAWPVVLEKAVFPSRYVGDEKAMQTCWNLMEDQRMESGVVALVPRIKHYFGPMVFNKLVKHAGEQAWLMLAGREYVEVDILKQAAGLFDGFCNNIGISNGAQQWDDIMTAYKAADTHQKIMDTVAEGLDFIRAIGAKMPENLDDHDKMKQGTAQPGDTARQGRGGSLADLFRKPEGQGEDAGGDAAPNGGRDKYGEQSKKDPFKSDGSRATEQWGTVGQSNGGEGDELWSDQNLINMLKNASEEYTSLARNHADVKEMARSANDFHALGGLNEYEGTGEGMIPELVQRSQLTARGIQEALESFVTQNMPTWHTHMETGVLDALAYRTREVGSRTYRRFLDDKGNDGLDVHVSMLADVSYSMAGGPILALSEAIYGCALACQAVGIGSTFTLWSSGNANYRIWADGNITPSVWPAMGGTDPTIALDDLATHNEEKATNHLVIIFTDGQWAHGFPSLRRWQADGRTIVLVRYGTHDGPMQKDMGADAHININDVAKLPQQLTNALLDVLSSKGGDW